MNVTLKKKNSHWNFVTPALCFTCKGRTLSSSTRNAPSPLNHSENIGRLFWKTPLGAGPQCLSHTPHAPPHSCSGVEATAVHFWVNLDTEKCDKQRSRSPPSSPLCRVHAEALGKSNLFFCKSLSTFCHLCIGTFKYLHWKKSVHYIGRSKKK